MEEIDFQKPWKNSDVKFIFDLNDPTPYNQCSPEEPQTSHSDTAQELSSMSDEGPRESSQIKENSEANCLYGCRLVLSMWSPVFAAMFEGNFREARMEEVHMLKRSVNQFLELLRVTHPPTTEIHYGNAKLLIPLAHQYQMTEILERCQSAIIQFPYPLDMNVFYLHIAVRFGLDRLYAHAAETVTLLAPSDLFLHNDTFTDLDLPTKCDLLTRKVTYLENMIFDQKLQAQKRGQVLNPKTVFRHMAINKCREHREASREAEEVEGRAHLAGLVPRCEKCCKAYKNNCIMEFYKMMSTYDKPEENDVIPFLPDMDVCLPQQ